MIRCAGRGQASASEIVKSIQPWASADSLWQVRAALIPFVPLATKAPLFPGMQHEMLHMLRTTVQRPERFAQLATGAPYQRRWVSCAGQTQGGPRFCLRICQPHLSGAFCMQRFATSQCDGSLASMAGAGAPLGGRRGGLPTGKGLPRGLDRWQPSSMIAQATLVAVLQPECRMASQKYWKPRPEGAAQLLRG
jgi:hypothetical protein